MRMYLCTPITLDIHLLFSPIRPTSAPSKIGLFIPANGLMHSGFLLITPLPRGLYQILLCVQIIIHLGKQSLILLEVY